MIRLDLPNDGLMALISFDRHNALILESPSKPQRILKCRTLGALEFGPYGGSTWVPFPGKAEALGSRIVRDTENAYLEHLGGCNGTTE